MSLIRIAARIAAVQALKGKTLVGDNVLDSQIGALDVDAERAPQADEGKHFIAVYSNASKAEGGENVLRSFLNSGLTDFLFEFGVTTAHTFTADNGESVVYPGIPATDAAFEFFLDMIARQIGDALTDPDNEWAEIFRSMSTRFSGVTRSRTSGSDQGVRLAAHQVAVSAVLITDPVAGAPLKETHALAKFFAKVAASDDDALKAQAALMLAQLSSGTAEWKQDLARYGMTGTEAGNLLLVPPGSMADIEIGQVSFLTVPA